MGAPGESDSAPVRAAEGVGRATLGGFAAVGFGASLALGGGFRLAQHPDDLSVADMITVLEGPVALTECQIGPSVCQHEGNCSVQEPWSVINRSVQNTLATITLSDIVNPNFPLIQVTSPQ